MKKFFILTIALSSFPVFAAPEILAECHGRTWLHRVSIDKEKNPAKIIYQRLGYAFGVYAEFPVMIRENNPAESKISFGNDVEQFGYSLNYSVKSETHNGKKMLLSSGFVFQRKGNVFDPIQKCWFDYRLLE